MDWMTSIGSEPTLRRCSMFCRIGRRTETFAIMFSMVGAATSLPSESFSSCTSFFFCWALCLSSGKVSHNSAMESGSLQVGPSAKDLQGMASNGDKNQSTEIWAEKSSSSGQAMFKRPGFHGIYNSLFSWLKTFFCDMHELKSLNHPTWEKWFCVALRLHGNLPL